MMGTNQQRVLLNQVVRAAQYHAPGMPAWAGVLECRCVRTRLWGNASPTRRNTTMPPSISLGSWWTAHLQLPGYDPIATAGPCHFDIRAAEQALVFCTQALHHPLSPWEEAIVLNLWGWRQADGRRRYVTVCAEPYRQGGLHVRGAGRRPV